MKLLDDFLVQSKLSHVIRQRHWTDCRQEVRSTWRLSSMLFHRPQQTGHLHTTLSSSVRRKVFAYLLTCNVFATACGRSLVLHVNIIRK